MRDNPVAPQRAGSALAPPKKFTPELDLLKDIGGAAMGGIRFVNNAVRSLPRSAYNAATGRPFNPYIKQSLPERVLGGLDALGWYAGAGKMASSLAAEMAAQKAAKQAAAEVAMSAETEPWIYGIHTSPADNLKTINSASRRNLGGWAGDSRRGANYAWRLDPTEEFGVDFQDVYNWGDRIDDAVRGDMAELAQAKSTLKDLIEQKSINPSTTEYDYDIERLNTIIKRYEERLKKVNSSYTGPAHYLVRTKPSNARVDRNFFDFDEDAESMIGGWDDFDSRVQTGPVWDYTKNPSIEVKGKLKPVDKWHDKRMPLEFAPGFDKTMPGYFDRWNEPLNSVQSYGEDIESLRFDYLNALVNKHMPEILRNDYILRRRYDPYLRRGGNMLGRGDY